MKKSFFPNFTVLIFISLFCSPLPTENTLNSNSIRLSLEKVLRDSAVYSGKPILAIIESSDSTVFSDLAWHTGMGKLIIPEKMINRYSKKFEVYLYWKNYPSKKDIETNSYYDTVFVTVGGNLKESNKVRVEVTNLPVIIDSVLIGDTVFNGMDTCYKYQVKNKFTDLPVRFYARDLDGKIPDITFSGNRSPIMQSSTIPLQMTYTVPAGNFNDTIHFLVFDHLGGSEYRDVNIKRYAVNLPPVIDSIVCEDTTLKGSSLYHVGFATIDTLSIKAYVHDPEGTDVKCTWKAYARYRVEKDDLNNNNNIGYVCTTSVCREIHKDTTIILDTLKLVAKDAQNDSTEVKIVLIKGKLNYPPTVKSIQVKDSVFTNPDSIISYKINYSTAYQIKITTYDSENDSLIIKWSGVPLSQLTEISDTTAVFTSTEAQITDTLIVTVSDSNMAVVRKLVLKTPIDK